MCPLPNGRPQELEGRWEFKGSWQDTYASSKLPAGTPLPPRVPRRAAGLQSDLLYTPWL